MNVFDKNILLFLNSFMNRWPYVDSFIYSCQYNPLLKGALFLAVLWGLWFSQKGNVAEVQRRHEILFGSICALVIGILLARFAAKMLPFRVRPFVNPEMYWHSPDGFDFSGLASWSAFPSDHAVVWFAMAAGIFSVNRLIGVFAAVYALFLALGRIYLGIHHPTDILAGAGIGLGLSALFHSEKIRTKLYQPMAVLEARRPVIFYAGAFLITYEIANLFDQVRPLAAMVLHLVK